MSVANLLPFLLAKVEYIDWLVTLINIVTFGEKFKIAQPFLSVSPIL